MFKPLTPVKSITYASGLTAIFGLVVVLPIVLNSQEYKNNYLVQVINSETTTTEDGSAWTCQGFVEYEDCKLFSVSEDEKNKLLNNEITEIPAKENVNKFSDFQLDVFFKLESKYTKNRDQHISLKTALNKKVLLSVIVDLDNWKDKQSLLQKSRYLFGQITKIEKNNAGNLNSKITCKLSSSCDVKVFDTKNTLKTNELGIGNFSQITNWNDLTIGSKIKIDLQGYYVLKNYEEVFSNGQNKFTVKFHKLQHWVKDSEQKIIQNIKDSFSDTIKNTSTKHAKNHYIIVKLLLSLGDAYRPDTILKTIEQQDEINGKIKLESLTSANYKWQNQKKGVLHYELIEIYEIKEQIAADEKNSAILDNENNLIQRVKYLESEIKKDKWLKVVFSTNQAYGMENFDLRTNGNLVIEGVEKPNHCFKRIPSSTTLTNC